MIKSHCLLFIAPFGVNQVEDMIRVCKSRLLSLSCWMFKLLQISSNLITSHSLDAFLQSKARMAAFIVSIASSKSPAAYWAWPRAKSDLASGVACKNLDTRESHHDWYLTLIVSTATTTDLASLSCSLNSSLLTFCFFPGKLWASSIRAKSDGFSIGKEDDKTIQNSKSTNTGQWHFSKVSTRSPCA